MISFRFFKRLGKKSLNVRFLSNETKNETTALYDFHVANGGKMVNFGGFLLPVQYSDLGIPASHLHTRKAASIFDVSHMLQTEIKGNDVISYLESVCTADLKALKENSSVLTVFTNENGGILDDLIITKLTNDHFYVVSNAAMKNQDQKLLLQALETHRKINASTNIKIQFFEPKEKGLIALQGPKAPELLQNLTDVDISKLYFMTTTTGKVANIENCRITRCGYTGEDGFEISMPAPKQTELVTKLLTQNGIKLAGLGARDSLRLEAGLCLYGSDMNANTTPVEAALTWLVAKRRREEKNFPGAEKIVQQIKNGSSIKRVGIIVESGPPARHGAKIVGLDGLELGEVTSGCPAPSLGKNIAMGYVPTGTNKVGTKIQLKIREKLYDAVISKMPFVSSHYYTKPK